MPYSVVRASVLHDPSTDWTDRVRYHITRRTDGANNEGLKAL